MKIHADDCNAACSEPPAYCAGMNHDHICRCTARADLAELVAAAEDVKRKDYLPMARWDRLDAALKPFREEPK